MPITIDRSQFAAAYYIISYEHTMFTYTKNAIFTESKK